MVVILCNSISLLVGISLSFILDSIILFGPFSRAFSIGDAFVGFHEDTIPSIVMQVCNDLEEEGEALHDGPEDPWEINVSLRNQLDSVGSHLESKQL